MTKKPRLNTPPTAEQAPRFERRVDEALELERQGKLREALAIVDELVAPDPARPINKRGEAPGNYYWEDVFALRARLREARGEPGFVDDLAMAASGIVRWDVKARAAELFLERREYERAIACNTSMLTGTRSEHFRVLSSAALAFMALAQWQEAETALRHVWVYAKPKPDEIPGMLARARKLVKGAPDEVAARLLDFAQRRPPKERKEVKRYKPPANREYRIWSTMVNPLHNPAHLDELKGYDGYDFPEGKPIGTAWPRNVKALMSKMYRTHNKLYDDVPNPFGAKVCSKRVVDFLRSKELPNLEFLPVTIIDTHDKPVKKDYFIVHVLQPQDALDKRASKAQMNALDKTMITEVESFVLKPERIDPALKLFRLHGVYDELVVEKELAEEIAAQGFQGVEIADPRKARMN